MSVLWLRRFLVESSLGMGVEDYVVEMRRERQLMQRPPH
jgi:hypothetical protein